MWSDLKDNHNKFYVAQALKSKFGNYSLWTRYGRVGVAGVSENKDIYGLNDVVKEFLKVEKTKLKKGYNEIKMSLGTSSKPAVKVITSDKDVAPSKLDANV
jgi:predicted DNA-binding WGR domain protein